MTRGTPPVVERWDIGIPLDKHGYARVSVADAVKADRKRPYPLPRRVTVIAAWQWTDRARLEAFANQLLTVAPWLDQPDDAGQLSLIEETTCQGGNQ